jgi:hypothetical protein
MIHDIYISFLAMGCCPIRGIIIQEYFYADQKVYHIKGVHGECGIQIRTPEIAFLNQPGVWLPS